MDTKPVFHGSDIEKICSYYGLKKEDIVKFGANVNPLGLSPKASAAIAAHVDIFSSYPDREYTTLRNTISEYCNIPADFILPGNGSSELISLLIQEKAPKHTRKHPGILPTSGKKRFRAGHSRSLQKAGTGIRFSHSLQP